MFEGPFDLLLFFIERDELDIHDIPISQITNDFLEHLHRLQEMNIEVASEFILVAATLMRIKAKTLLPRPILDEEGNEIDPRQELVKHLLEYRKYKSVVKQLGDMEQDRLQKDKRGNLVAEINSLAETTNVEAELQNVDLYKLLKAFEKALQRFELEKERPVHTVVQFPYSMGQQRKFILQTLQKKGRQSFGDIILSEPNRIVVIFNFLAILELLNLKKIRLQVGEGYNNFWIEIGEQQLVK